MVQSLRLYHFYCPNEYTHNGKEQEISFERWYGGKEIKLFYDEESGRMKCLDEEKRTESFGFLWIFGIVAILIMVTVKLLTEMGVI